MKIIVLGDGLLGQEIIKQTNWSYISRKKDKFDIRNHKEYKSYNLHNYDVIVNCIAYTKTYAEEKDLNWEINYQSVVELSNFCRENNVKLVHISSDYIYSGSKCNASENDVPVHLPTWYGYTKLLGDAYVQLNPTNLIVRTSHKPYPFPYKNAWCDQFTNGDYVNVISNLIVKLIEKNASGVYNVGTEVKTWFTLTKNEFKTSPIKKPDNAPSDITMSLNKAQNYIKN